MPGRRDRAVKATEVPEPAVGEAWAYRARNHDPLVRVVVVRFGVKTPRRVLVRFVDDEFEGLRSSLMVATGAADTVSSSHDAARPSESCCGRDSVTTLISAPAL
jgi:hypothetical protein